MSNFIAPSLPLQGDQTVDAHAARAPASPYSGGRVWSIVLCVSRGDDRALLASGGVRLRRQGTGREGRGGGGKEGEEKRREEVEWRWLWWVGGKGRRGGGEGMLVGSCGASTGVRATTSTVSPPTT